MTVQDVESVWVNYADKVPYVNVCPEDLMHEQI